jgi:nicotinate-nucleotide adenylyltransferase
MTTGIIGGTFDPIHTGHLIAAEQARTRLGLTEVLFVPAGQPWFKANNEITATNHRMEMVRLAISSNPSFKLCTVEIGRTGPSYTIDTMVELRDRQGISNPYFILGGDSLKGFPLWKEPVKLLQMCRLVVVSRSGSFKIDLSSLEAAVPGLVDNVTLLEMPIIDISSSNIRSRITQGESIRYLVPAEVRQYIIEHRLYL